MDDFRSELGRLTKDLGTQIRLMRDFGLRNFARADPLPELQVNKPVHQEIESVGQAGLFSKPSAGAAADARSTWHPNSSSPEEAQAELDALRARLGDCQRCRLGEQRRSIVFGEGNPKARVVLVGEGPGGEEDRTGRPFVGAAGQLLDRMLVAMGLGRDQIYICNVVKCRPPQNRTPEPEEMEICGRFLADQLKIIHPRHIVCLGATAAHFLLKTDLSVSKLRGRIHDHPSGARVLPTYHPAYLLRNQAAKKPVWEDLQLVMAEMAEGEQP